jgi:fluoroquinolone transport system ATP-binding protein
MADLIRVRDLRFAYPGARTPAVLDVSFEVGEGEIFGFLGPSGAGKSTTQKILTGLLRGGGGEVSVFGRALQALGPDYYEDVGVGFEVPNLYLKLTALENLRAFGALFRGPLADPRELLARVGLADAADVRVAEFSKGMRARLGFVRALLHGPKLLFLDEPTAGLDPVNADVVKGMIREAREGGATVFLTTHDMNAADQLCDRVAFIVDGGLRCIDAPRALKLEHGRREVRVEWRDDGALRSRCFPLDGLGDCTPFLALLREERIETLHTQETTLERVFIDVTGRSLS